ncbi:MAG TPA: hypothetical protein VGI50_00510 [Solirubrobacteraceae bacterium]
MARTTRRRALTAALLFVAALHASAADSTARPRQTPPACSVRIPLARIPEHVVVIRDGKRVPPTPGSKSSGHPFLQDGDQLVVHRRWSPFAFSYAGNVFRITLGRIRLVCSSAAASPWQTRGTVRVIAVALEAGMIRVQSGSRWRHALVLTQEMVAFATAPATSFAVTRNERAHSTQAWTFNQLIVAAEASDPAVRINTRIAYTAISDDKGLRLDIWPFSISPLQRPTTPADALAAYWADGLPCSVGCTAPGAISGWPIQPFHQQHAVRAGINELRPANFHVAVDIEAHNFQPVYAIQSGYASIRYPNTGDVNVDVGDFYYWHISPTVSEGQYVVAYKTMIGRVLPGFYHLALSEGNTHDYLNPLRPGGSLRPYTDTEAPVIGLPRIFSDGRVIVGAFDPQSFVATGFPYETPVLAPSSLAWRLYNQRGQALTGLEWAMRGSQNYSPGLKPVIFAPGATNPGFVCFLTRRRCIPNWVYWLAGGLTQPLPLGSLRPGRYRLTVYAWDWADNTSALDFWFNAPLARGATLPRHESGPLNAQFDYDETGASGPPPP